MSLRNALQEIAVAWPQYLASRIVDKQAKVHGLVKDDVPALIGAALGPGSHLRVEGSDGRGNITAAPWFGVFDPRVTTSATNGYYVVYLFSVDMMSVTLCIAFGTTQFEEQFGGPTHAFPRMREAADRLHGLYRRVAPERYSRAPIELRATRANKLHFAYEQSAIFSLPPYDVMALPSDENLTSDLREIVELYAAIVEDPLKPEIELLLQATVPIAATIKTIEVRDFVSRQPAKRNANEGAPRLSRRYSLQSRRVGDAGERVVLRHEQEKLTACGRAELVDRIRHHAAEGEFPGWDITSYDEDGQEIFIEVKASLGSSISAVDLTANEWAAATMPDNCGRYFIYIVSNALSERPIIEKLRDPFGFVSTGELVLEPCVYQLSFRRRADLA